MIGTDFKEVKKVSRTTLKLIHYLALSAFVGSIFAHILLGTFANSDLAGDTFLLRIKAMITNVLIFGGLGFLAASGAGLIVVTGKLTALKRWLKIKIVLVVLVIANTKFILAPAGAERARQASDALVGTPLLPNYSDLGFREDVFGAVNLALVLVIIVLSIRRLPT